MSFTSFFNRNLDYVTEFFFGEPGLGSLFGGYGIIFWAFCFPSALYLFGSGLRWIFRTQFQKVFWRESSSSKDNREMELFSVFFWGQFLLGLIFLYGYAVSVDLLEKSFRLVLFISGLGIIAFSVVFSKYLSPFKNISFILKIFCLAAALLTLLKLGQFYEPTMDLREVLKDREAGLKTSPYRYIYLKKAFEPLDLLTRPEKGMKVYVAGPKNYFFAWPVYGTHLQNKIWNFKAEHYTKPPDAFVFLLRKGGGKILYMGPRFTPYNVIFNEKYFLVTQDQNSLLFFKNSLLDSPEIKKELIQYYERLSKRMLPLARYLSEHLDEKGVFLISSDIGYALRYLNLINEIPQQVIFTPLGSEVPLAKRVDAPFFYTLGSPLSDFHAEPVLSIPLENGEFKVFKNMKKDLG